MPNIQQRTRNPMALRSTLINMGSYHVLRPLEKGQVEKVSQGGLVCTQKAWQKNGFTRFEPQTFGHLTAFNPSKNI